MSSTLPHTEEMELFPDYEEEDDDLEQNNPYVDAHVRSFSFDDEDRPIPQRGSPWVSRYCTPQVRGLLCCFLCGIICISLLIIILSSVFAVIFHDNGSSHGNQAHGNYSSDTAYYESGSSTYYSMSYEENQSPLPTHSASISMSRSPTPSTRGETTASPSPSITPSVSPSRVAVNNTALPHVVKGELATAIFADRPQAMRSLWATLTNAVDCQDGCEVDDVTEAIRSDLIFDASACQLGYEYDVQANVENLLAGLYEFDLMFSAEADLDSIDELMDLPMTPAQEPYTEDIFNLHTSCGVSVLRRVTLSRSELPNMRSCSYMSTYFPGLSPYSFGHLSLSPVGIWWYGQAEMTIVQENQVVPVHIAVELQYGNAMSALSSVIQSPTRAIVTVRTDEESVAELFQDALREYVKPVVC